MQSLIDERPFAFDLVEYATWWDSLKTSIALVIQKLKEVTSESVASSCSRQDLLQENLASVTITQKVMAVKQTEMDKWMKSLDSRQDIMGMDLRAILDLRKKTLFLGT